MFEINTTPLLTGMLLLESSPLVLRAGLAGDHLRTIVAAGLDVPGLKEILGSKEVEVQAIQAGEPNLEDVFVFLAKERD